jgi:anaphase-promoting complex subunit 8
LHQIATLYERLGDEDEAAAYMELTLQQETGGAPIVEGNESEEEEYSSASEQAAQSEGEHSGEDEDGRNTRSRRHRRKPRPRTSSFGMQQNDSTAEEMWHHPTATTSKARLWLAQHALRNGDLDRADQLAGELCQDGMEVEEAKALMRDIRARREDVG